MDVFTILQIIIALTFIYFIVSLVVSEVQEQLAAFAQLRAKNLKKAIEIFIGKKLCEELYDVDKDKGLLFSTFYQTNDSGKKTSQGKSPKWLFIHGPSYLEGKIFAESLVRLINNRFENQDKLSPNQELFPISADEANQNIVEKLKSIEKSIDPDIINRLIEIVYITKLKHDNPTIADFTNEIANTFNEVMERTSGVYKRNAKGLSIIFGIVSTVAFNIDTLHIVNHLYKDPGLRDNFEQMATNLIEVNQQCLNEANNNQNEIENCEDLDATIEDIKTSFTDNQTLPIGWNWDDGDILTQIQGQGGWQVGLGWFISAIAIAMGAPFWFELLGKVVNVRNTLRPLSPSPPKIRLPVTTQPATATTIENTRTVRAATITEPTPTNITEPLPTPSTSTMEEIRGVWLLSHYNSDVLKSPYNIKRALGFLEECGFNTLFVAVWNQGYTAFESQVMAEHGFPKQDPKYVELGIDPLQEVIDQAKGRNFAVFPWFEYGFAAAPPSPDSDHDHILRIKPQWIAKDQFGKKVRHGSGGLIWMNSLNKEVQQFMTALILEVIDKYGKGIAGIQGCDRLPAMPHLGGYGDETIEDGYLDSFGLNPPSNTKDPKWVQFRADILTNYLKDLRSAIKAKDSKYVFSIAPSPFPFGLNEVLQDSDDWVERGLVDFLCPQFYRPNFSGYKYEVDRLTQKFLKNQLKKYVPGIAFTANNRQLTPRDIIEAVKYNRQRGLGGQVFFYYEGLLKNNNAIATALKSTANFSQVANIPKPPFV